MVKYILECTNTKENIAILDVSALVSENANTSTEHTKLSLQLINSWIKDVTNNNVILPTISLIELKEGITQGEYSIRIFSKCNLVVRKTHYNVGIRKL